MVRVEQSQVASIVEHFQSMADPRHLSNRRHLLVDVMVLSVCGVIVGCEGPTAKLHFIDQNPNLAGYKCAPRLFYFTGHEKWYLVYQTQPPAYSTTDDISKPETWTAPQRFFAGQPESMPRLPIDYHVICDGPVGPAKYTGHRTIRIQEFDLNEKRSVGEKTVIVDGGTDISKEPIWCEAPHLYKINGTYYLLCAEGGTGWAHTAVIFRSDSIRGPYVPWDKNPILAAADLPAAGHLDRRLAHHSAAAYAGSPDRQEAQSPRGQARRGPQHGQHPFHRQLRFR